jgi:hypothetical protein
MILLQVLNYPSGFISKNIYLTVAILFSVIIAYFIRLFGLDQLTFQTLQVVGGLLDSPKDSFIGGRVLIFFMYLVFILNTI